MSNINKIRLSGTTYSIQDLNATKTVELTQAEYDALSVKDQNTFYIITDATAGDLSNYYTKSETSGATEISTALNAKADTATTYTKTETDNAITAATSTKQDTLVSGTNIKTINGETLLGEGNITIQGGGGSSYTAGDGIDINNDVISVTGKVDTSTYETYTAATDTALASKQTTLTAGTGISIVDNVISATGGGGGGLTEDDELLLSTALTDLNDRKIDASEVKSNYQKKGDYATKSQLDAKANVSDVMTLAKSEENEMITAYALNDLNNKFGGLSLVKITESEYAALTTKDENTLYIVVADPS